MKHIMYFVTVCALAISAGAGHAQTLDAKQKSNIDKGAINAVNIQTLGDLKNQPVSSSSDNKALVKIPEITTNSLQEFDQKTLQKLDQKMKQHSKTLQDILKRQAEVARGVSRKIGN